MQVEGATAEDVLDHLIGGDRQQLLTEDAMGGPKPMENRVTSGPSGGSLNGRTNGGLTMYERSMLQKEERERKMRSLQEKLMADYTFTPSRAMRKTSSSQSLVSSIGASPSSMGTADMSVFSRLYHAETAASRGQRFNGTFRKDVILGWSTPGKSTIGTPARIPRSAPGSRSGSVPSSPRLEELYKFGEEKLRSRQLSREEELKRLRERLEEQELQKTDVYTFRPRTKWNLVAERRRRARMELERAAEEARRLTPKARIKDEEQQGRIVEEVDLEECTFTPKTQWNLIEERRKQAALSPAAPSQQRNDVAVSRSERERMERDRKYEEPELKECTFFPVTNWKAKTSTRLPNGNNNHDTYFGDMFEKLVASNDKSSRPETPPPSDVARHNVKLVSTHGFQEEQGKNANPPTVVRQNMVRQIVSPKTPEWKKKYRKIGQKAEMESNVEAGGRGVVDTRKRGHTVIKSPGLDPSETPEKVAASANAVKDLGIPLAQSAPPLQECVAEECDGHVSLTDVSKGEVTIEQQKLLAQQAMEIRLAQKQRAKELAAAERKQEEEEALAAKKMAEDVKQQNAITESATSEDIKDPQAQEKKSKARKWYDRMSKKLSKKAPVQDENRSQHGALEPNAADTGAVLEPSTSHDERKESKAEAQRLAEDEAKQARLAAEIDSKKLAEEQARLEAEAAMRFAEEQSLQEAEKAEMEAKRLAEEEARLAAEAEAKVLAEEEARLAAEAEAKRLAEEQARRAEEQTRLAAETEAKRLAEEQARFAAEAEAIRLAEEQARLEAETEAKRLAEEEAKLAAEAEAKILAEKQARLEAEAEVQRLAGEEARLAAEAEAKRLADEQARLEAEVVAKRLADEQARLAAEAEAKRLAEENARLEAEAGAKNPEAEKPAQSEAAAAATAATAAVTESQLKSEQQNDEQLESFINVESGFSTSDAEGSSMASSDDSVDLDLDNALQSQPSSEDKSNKKVKSDRAKKWKDRLSKKKKKSQKKGDAPSDVATDGVETSEAYPKVLYSDDGDQTESNKLPEIGSI